MINIYSITSLLYKDWKLHAEQTGIWNTSCNHYNVNIILAIKTTLFLTKTSLQCIWVAESVKFYSHYTTYNWYHHMYNCSACAMHMRHMTRECFHMRLRRWGGGRKRADTRGRSIEQSLSFSSAQVYSPESLLPAISCYRRPEPGNFHSWMVRVRVLR